jgi:hypothetical protein
MIARLRKRNRAKVESTGLWSGYSSDPKLLKEYMILIGGLNALIALTIAATAKSKRGLPGSMGALDFVVLALGTHKLARLLSKDKVTSPLRAPFVRYEEGAGAGEVEEAERGEGMRRAIGDLATCPYCATPWAATAFVLGHAVSPRVTRMYACILALTTIGHFLNQAYAKAKEMNE